MKLLSTAVILVPTLALAACGREETCTPELMQTKTEALTKAVQEMFAKDPAKSTEAMGKLQKFTEKYATADQSQACKAADELLATIKG
ncbi:hypothetical protein BTE77_34625 [Ensifer adhaerens]|nr:hypothetical protein BTE77_34625 [Ensifer adhaerens]